MSNNLKQELAKIEIPMELHERSKMGVKKAKSEMKAKIKVYARKRLVSAVLAISLIIPTGAFAYQTLLVDEFYGSFDNLKKHISSATMEGYLLLDTTINLFEEIINAVESISPKIKETKESSIKIQKEKDVILDVLKETGAIAEDVAASAEEISASAEEMSASTEEVSTSAVSLGEMTNEMRKKINFFKMKN